MSKFILTHTNGMVTIKIDADIVINSKTQRIIESMCKNAIDKIADYIEGKEDGFGKKAMDSNK